MQFINNPPFSPTCLCCQVSAWTTKQQHLPSLYNQCCNRVQNSLKRVFNSQELWPRLQCTPSTTPSRVSGGKNRSSAQTNGQQWLASAGGIRSVGSMILGPCSWSRRRRKWCCSSRRRWQWVGLIRSEEMLQVRSRGGGGGSSRGHGILTLVSRCIWRSWYNIRMISRFPCLGYSNRVWRSLYNFEVAILAIRCTPTNRYTKFTDLTQLSHGLRKEVCRDTISKVLQIITKDPLN